MNEKYQGIPEKYYKDKCKSCGYEYYFEDKVLELGSEAIRRGFSVKNFNINNINFLDFFCPKCHSRLLINFFSSFLEYVRIFENEMKFRYERFHPLTKKLDHRIGKRFRDQWIDYYGIIFKKKYQIYSSIESKYLEDWNKLDCISKSFLSGNLRKKIIENYSLFSKKCNVKIPNFYLFERDDLMCIIIGVFSDLEMYNSILKRMMIFVNNCIVHSGIININHLKNKKEGRRKKKLKFIQKYMNLFVMLVEKLLFNSKDVIHKNIVLGELNKLIFDFKYANDIYRNDYKKFLEKREKIYSKLIMN